MYIIIMKNNFFEWDDKKNALNIEKHGLSFYEAATVFCDERAIVFDDPDHSGEEQRFLIIGMSRSFRICIVSHCYRGEDDIIRIISARKATRKEEEYYRNGSR